MKRFYFLFTLFVFSIALHATHNLAGEISVNCIGTNSYEVIVTTYQNTLSQTNPCSLSVNWGDGSPLETIDRFNGNLDPNAPCTQSGIPAGEMLDTFLYPNTRRSKYRGTHLYTGPGNYRVSITDPNRVSGISNLVNSVNVPFYIATTILIDPQLQCNSTPYLTTIPLDKACKGHCYYHNPGAVDPDGDSLSYSIGPCLDTTGNPFPPSVYTMPDVMAGGTLAINPVTGDLSWCSPQVAGKYNLAIYIYEWKRLSNGNHFLAGKVERDMLIEVLGNCSNDNPDIPSLSDICVDAGDSIHFSFVTTDVNAGDSVKVSAYGGPFNVVPAASISPDNIYSLAPATTTFGWQTTCDRVRLQPWQVTFKATDNALQIPLSDIQTINIAVISPGPSFLTATPLGSEMHLTWGQNPCDPVGNNCTGYKIFRKQGCNTWNHSQCETGVPSYTGYVLIGTVNGISNTTFVDDNNGLGLIPGVDYSYRVCADFFDGAQSYSSPEACARLLIDIPVITNADVMSTGSNDSIYVRWVNAIPDGINFDTVSNPGPWILVLQKSKGFSFANPVTVATFSSAIYSQLATTYVDHSDSTSAISYSYRLYFYGRNGMDTLGNSPHASSVFLTSSASDNTVSLHWQYVVPWQNDSFAIYRLNNSTLVWDSIALVANTNSYIDDSLENGVQYCYYVTAHGSYFNPLLPPIIYNRSQRICATPIDLTPPCSPVLVVNSDCFIGLNQLGWTNPMHMNCGTDDVVAYHVWFTDVEGGTMSIISTISTSDDTSIIYSNLFSVAGCYAISAVDSFNNESALSNSVCVDNCPDYTLPNVFTPNGDNTNDQFVPFPYHYIKDIDIKIYDRWGTLVFETTDPEIHWTGRDMTTGKLCTDGVYYYTVIVNEIHLTGIVPREMKGFVHLFGKDVGQFH